MWKSFGIFAIGALSGAAFLLAFQNVDDAPEPTANEPIAANTIPTLSDADVDSARRSGFADINSIEDIVALPTVFARREALHVLAGRSDADRLQKLISEGNRISERALRGSVLNILFKRLAEVDPNAALALARVDPYKNDDSLERTIWRTWARNDLDEAIFAVNIESNSGYQADAAQSLYAAYGYMGNETTQRIAQELGIEPNRQTRLRFLRILLEDSPRRTIEFISEESSTLRRDEYINWLAYALDTNDQSVAMSYSEYFSSAADRAYYSSVVEDRFARINPVETLQQALATNDIGPNSDFHSALQELASKDITEAMNFYGQIDAPQAKMMAAFVIADELATSDPVAALEWVRSLEDARKQHIESAVLVRIAESNPEFALETAATLPTTQRVSSTSHILMAVARTDPALAKNLLASLADDSNKPRIQSKLGQAWLMEEPTAAIEWLGTLDAQEASDIAASATGILSRTRPETAYRLLELLDEPQRLRSAKELVGQFASVGDVAKARALIDEYGGEEGFETIEADLIGGLARHDSETATQLALQLQDDQERDQAFSRISRSLAADNPEEAIRLLQNITDPSSRKRTVRSIAGTWYRSDPGAAVGWLASLPANEERDSAIARVSMSFDDLGQQELELIDSISDAKSRTSTRQTAILRLARTDKAAALRILEGMDIPEEQKVKFRETIGSNGQ
ncbi:MAG: hypothetical protein K0U72_03110 [Gammaproteobacteria bacterium]|nr:hypothetical protein [Gammaproteobacteria bacterium]